MAFRLTFSWANKLSKRILCLSYHKSLALKRLDVKRKAE
ncbi:Uncharacterised protein [Streptococcus pneumoniae]|nr:Uncharacterised protein [Streptococcus pneumoniae]